MTELLAHGRAAPAHRRDARPASTSTTTSATATRCSGGGCPTSTCDTADGPTRVSTSCCTTPGRCCSTSARRAASTSRRGPIASDRVDATYADGAWELPVIGEVAAPPAVLIRPDGHVAWAGDLTDPDLSPGAHEVVRRRLLRRSRFELRDCLDGSIGVEAAAGQQRVGALAPDPRVCHSRQRPLVAREHPPGRLRIGIRTLDLPLGEHLVRQRAIDALAGQLGSERALPARPGTIARLDPRFRERLIVEDVEVKRAVRCSPRRARPGSPGSAGAGGPRRWIVAAPRGTGARPRARATGRRSRRARRVAPRSTSAVAEPPRQMLSATSGGPDARPRRAPSRERT